MFGTATSENNLTIHHKAKDTYTVIPHFLEVIGPRIPADIKINYTYKGLADAQVLYIKWYSICI